MQLDLLCGLLGDKQQFAIMQPMPYAPSWSALVADQRPRLCPVCCQLRSRSLWAGLSWGGSVPELLALHAVSGGCWAISSAASSGRNMEQLVRPV